MSLRANILSRFFDGAGEGPLYLPDLTLWGGIPQEFLLEMHDRQAFETAVAQAVRDAGGDGRTILGVADRVPVAADLDRLESLPSLVEQIS